MAESPRLCFTKLVILLHTIIPILSSATYRKLLFAPLTMMPCDLLSSPQTLYWGTPTLDDTASLTVTETSLGGWIFPRGFDINTYYTIFSFHDAIISPIYTVAYQPSTYSIRQTLGALTNTYIVPQFTTSEWFYIASFIEFDSSIPKMKSGTVIYKTDSQIILNAVLNSNSIHMTYFTKANLIFNIGFSSSTFPVDIEPACALMKYVYAFSSNAIGEIGSFRFDIQAMGTHLLNHFDDFYTPNNLSQLFSTSGQSENSLKLLSSSTDPFLLSTATSPSITTDYINASQNIGFTIQFYIKTTHPSFSTTIRVLTIIEGLGFLDFISNSGGKYMQLGGNPVINISNFSVWLEIIVFMKFGVSNVIGVSERSHHSDRIKMSVPSTYQRTLRVRFGDANNTSTFRLRHIHIFSGVYIASDTNANCFFSMLDGANPQCLVCNSSYLVNFQPVNPTCEGDFTYNRESMCPFIREWSPARAACPHPNMIHNRPNSDTNCRCRKQQYFDGTKCVKCPRYCSNCVNLTGVCVYQNIYRVGIVCPSNTYFDDGFNCKERVQLIPEQVSSIKVFWFPSSLLEKTFNNSFLQLEAQTSFLISFSFTPILASITSSSVIAFVKLGSNEYITITLSQQTIGSLIVGLYINQILVTSRSVHPYLTTWYALYTDLSKTVLYYHTNGNLNYLKSTNSPLTMQPVTICIGMCSSSFITQPAQTTGTPYARAVRYIRNAGNPLNYPTKELWNLLCDEQPEIGFFKLDLRLYPDSYLGVYASSTVAGSNIDFGNTPVILTDQLKGFGFFNSKTIGTVDIGKIDIPCSFSTDIFISKMETQTTLLSYDFDPSSKFVIEYYLVPQEVDNSVTIRICVEYECQDTIEPGMKLYMYERNFLAILTQDRSQFSIEYMKIAFKIYCNFVTETLIFYKERPKGAGLKKSIVKIGLQSEVTEEYLFFLNRIQFVKGNTYHYEDRINGNPCYLSLDSPTRSYSQCILPKDGFVLGPISPISNSACENPLSTTINFINIYTRECIDSNQLRSECIDVDQNVITCKVCQNGYYLLFQGDLLTPQATCEPCSAQCATCIGDSSICLTCSDPLSNVTPPECLCDQPGYFLDSSSQCLKCDDRCETCAGTANNCLTCSSRRILPPSCQCDASSYEVIPAGSSIPQCTPYKCNNQCESCTSSPSNCLTCKENRENPPTCSCVPGTIPNADGTCQICSSNSRYDSAQNACVPCSGLCDQCSSTSSLCTACIPGLFLQNGICFCSGNQQAIIQSFNQKAYCANEMDVQFSLEISGRNQYVFVFTFEFELNSIDFTQNLLSNVFLVYIDEVPMEMYKLSNPVIQKNQLRIDLIGLSSFRATSGSILFLVNQVFINTGETHILSRNYLSKPFSFDNIGPFVFAKETDSWNSMFDVGDIKQGNESLFAIIQGFQLISYFLNTLQPTVLFLLLPISFPPNLYGFLQKLGLAIYPDVQDYQGTPNAQGYQFYDFEGDQSESNTDPTPIQTARSPKRILNQNNEQQANSSRISDEFAFKRLGFSSSALISMPLICLKYIVLLVLIFFNELMLQKARTSDTWIKAKSFLIGQLLTEGEVNLLIVSVAVLVQLSNINQFDWTSRYGFYLSCVIILVNLYCITKLVRELFIYSRSQVTNQIELTRLESIRIDSARKSKIDQKAFNSDSQSTQCDVNEELLSTKFNRNNVYWETLTSRIKKKRIPFSNTYFLLQMMKKFLLIGVIFFLRNFPKAVCMVCGMVYLLSSLSTIQMKPYLNVRSRYFKVITDIMFSAIWILHYWIVDIDSSMIDQSHEKSAESELNRDDVQLYFLLGEVVIILLMILNIGYAIESVCCLVDSLKEYLRNRKAQKEKEMINNGLLKVKQPFEGKLSVPIYQPAKQLTRDQREFFKQQKLYLNKTNNKK